MDKISKATVVHRPADTHVLKLIPRADFMADSDRLHLTRLLTPNVVSSNWMRGLSAAVPGPVSSYWWRRRIAACSKWEKLRLSRNMTMNYFLRCHDIVIKFVQSICASPIPPREPKRLASTLWSVHTAWSMAWSAWSFSGDGQDPIPAPGLLSYGTSTRRSTWRCAS